MKQKANAGIAATGARPAMDRPSVAFAWFLDSIAFEVEQGVGIVMMCTLCTESICDVEQGDTMRVMLNTALAHTCE